MSKKERMLQQSVMIVSEKAPRMGVIKNGAQIRRHFLAWDNYVARLPEGEEHAQFYKTLEKSDLDILQVQIADRLGGGLISESESEVESPHSSDSDSPSSEDGSVTKMRLAGGTSRGSSKEELVEEGRTKIQFRSKKKQERKEAKNKEEIRESKEKAKATRVARREARTAAR